MGYIKNPCCIKFLHLALAISLLHVDPNSLFLQQRLRNWDTQLEQSEGNGWELELLRAVPIVPPENPYANRKSILPLIEDLVLFDLQSDTEQLRTEFNVTAYQLISDGLGAGGSVGSDQTATQAVQDLQVPVLNSSATVSAIIENESVLNMNRSPNVTPDLEIVFNTDQFLDQRSIWEQNLADLQDFGDLSALNAHSNVLLKDEINGGINGQHLDINLEAFIPHFSEISFDLHESDFIAGASNGSFPTPIAFPCSNLEKFKDKNETAGLKSQNQTKEVPSCSKFSRSTQHAICCQDEVNSTIIKNETNEETAAPEVDLSPFISVVELDEEESEIVEVLWKQDVDLGYSLTPRKVNLSEGQPVDKYNVENEYEKLNVQDELKLDETQNDKNFDFGGIGIDNERNSIPFAIDNETGEYIRLPLDDLFKDVLHLEGLEDGNSAENTIPADFIPTSASQAPVVTNDENIELPKEQFQTPEDIKNEENLNNSTLVKKVSSENSNNNNSIEETNRPQFSDLDDFDSDLPSPLFDLDDEARDELAEFDMMIQSASASFHHHHHSPHPHAVRNNSSMHNYAAVGGGANSAFHRQTSTSGFHPHGHHQGRIPLSRSISMEQHLQDIASLFNPIPNMGVADLPPYAAYAPHAYPYQSPGPQHAQYPPPPPPHGRHPTHHSMLHPNAGLSDICPPSQPHYGHNLGSAVSSSMHLTNHETDVGLGATGGISNAYKMEQDMTYYSNASSEMNHTTDGFINSILNDEDLHLMDMNVNNDYCRMVDVNNCTTNHSSVGQNLPMNAGSGAGNNGMTTDLLSGQQSAVAGSAAGIGPAGDRLDASSDSAVSSMGSERVPSLSDGEWGEGSDSAQDYHAGKYGGPYDYSYNHNTGGHNRLREASERQPPVAQKKHQMFGKRFLNEQSNMPNISQPASTTQPAGPQPLLHGSSASIKYEYEPYVLGVPPALSNANVAQSHAASTPSSSELQHSYDLKYGAMGASPYSLDFSLRSPRNAHEIVQHNHTYNLPQGSCSLPRPQQRDKKHSGGVNAVKSIKINPQNCGSNSISEEEHLTRDEKRARALNIPITVNDIINLPMDEFNERLSKYDLNENQLSLIRDIRRRGKNKVAAQNCRKRKLDQILSLEDEVKEVRRRKEHLQQQHEELFTERKRISTKFASLHRHIFQYLRDPEGNPCLPSDYSLQLATDGSVYLLPRDSSNVSDAIAPITTTRAATSSTVRASTHLLHAQRQTPHNTQSHHHHLNQQAGHNGTLQQQQQEAHHQVPPKE